MEEKLQNLRLALLETEANLFQLQQRRLILLNQIGVLESLLPAKGPEHE